MPLPLLIRTDLSSRIGSLILIFADGRLCMLDYSDRGNRCAPLLARHFGAPSIEKIETIAIGDPAVAPTVKRIRDYFEGDLTAMDDLEIDLRGTSFQKSVWQALRAIPAGHTRSYKDIATQLGKPNGAQAVGGANAANPIAIGVPCHRVIRANGRLTGYGNRKEQCWLLKHEKAIPS